MFTNYFMVVWCCVQLNVLIVKLMNIHTGSRDAVDLVKNLCVWCFLSNSVLHQQCFNWMILTFSHVFCHVPCEQLMCFDVVSDVLWWCALWCLHVFMSCQTQCIHWTKFLSRSVMMCWGKYAFFMFCQTQWNLDVLKYCVKLD